ncbi:Glycosyl hydrolase [Planctomycetales bacterium 10988]|nr:Glycosyl hydrolase [Planctomycetales bacterium 10988]
MLKSSFWLMGCSLLLFFQSSVFAQEQIDVIDLTPSTEDGFTSLFNGKDLTGWHGETEGYSVSAGTIVSSPDTRGNIYTKKEYQDFIFRFEFKLTPGANSGIGIHAPITGNPAYAGIELQVLDNTAEKYQQLKPYQYHGSAYGISPAKRGALKPVGEWNEQEVIVRGSTIQVRVNGQLILDTDLKKAAPNGKTMDERDHPGLARTTGYIALLGHRSEVSFRNLRVKELLEL